MTEPQKISHQAVFTRSTISTSFKRCIEHGIITRYLDWLPNCRSPHWLGVCLFEAWGKVPTQPTWVKPQALQPQALNPSLHNLHLCGAAKQRPAGGFGQGSGQVSVVVSRVTTPDCQGTYKGKPRGMAAKPREVPWLPAAAATLMGYIMAQAMGGSLAGSDTCPDSKWMPTGIHLRTMHKMPSPTWDTHVLSP